MSTSAYDCGRTVALQKIGVSLPWLRQRIQAAAPKATDDRLMDFYAKMRGMRDGGQGVRPAPMGMWGKFDDATALADDALLPRGIDARHI